MQPSGASTTLPPGGSLLGRSMEGWHTRTNGAATVSRDRDAVVVGAGPNGLIAAITLAREGWKVTVLEAAPVAGGGLRSELLTRAGYLHDVCAAVHALAPVSPAFAGLALEEHGARWVHPDVAFAHPLDGGRAALVNRDVDETAAALGHDARRVQADVRTARATWPGPG